MERSTSSHSFIFATAANQIQDLTAKRGLVSALFPLANDTYNGFEPAITVSPTENNYSYIGSCHGLYISLMTEVIIT